MKRLMRASSDAPGMFEHYEVIRHTADRFEKYADVQVLHVMPTSNGIIDTEIEGHMIRNDQEKIVDPNWGKDSKPVAKPDGFNINDATTWGGIIYADIPMIDDPKKMLFDRLMDNFENYTATEAFLRTLMDAGKLPGESLSWKLA